jgi:hypothetical protein
MNNLETISEKLARKARRSSFDISNPVKNYTKKDIKELIKQGKSDEDICDILGASETEVMRIRPSIDAHYTMGTYSRYACKIRNRKLTKEEKEKVYKDIENGMRSEELAEKYRMTRIRAMAFYGWHTRRLNEE